MAYPEGAVHDCRGGPGSMLIGRRRWASNDEFCGIGATTFSLSGLGWSLMTRMWLCSRPRWPRRSGPGSSTTVMPMNQVSACHGERLALVEEMPPCVSGPSDGRALALASVTNAVKGPLRPFAVPGVNLAMVGPE